MSKKNKKKEFTLSYAPDGDEKLIPDEDEEFERESAERYREEYDEEAAMKRAEAEKQRKRREYEQKLRQEKIAMIKAKQGIETQEDGGSDDEDEEPGKMSLWKRIENFWYHYKWITVVCVIVAVFAGYMIYDYVTKVEPDIIIVVTADNGLSYREESVRKHFEKYAEDLNGDGKVYVEVIFAPMNAEGGSDQYTQGNETKLYSYLAAAQCVLYLTDDDSSFSLSQVTFDDLTKKFDSEYVSDEGIVLYSGLMREGFNWAQMPEDMVLRLRTPVPTMYDDLEAMQKTHDNATGFVERLIDAMDEFDKN